MKLTRYSFLILLSAFTFLFSVFSCDKDCDDDKNTGKDCTNYRPIIFLHGFLASGDTWANQVMRFSANGYCDKQLYAYDWNTLGNGNDVNALNAFIDTVLAKTGATQVDLVGHSAGGGYGYNFCNDTARAKKVAHYVHIGSSSQSSPAGVNDEVPSLNISSAGDAVAGATSITGGTNIELQNKDHYEVATCAEAFIEMFKFFNNGSTPSITTFATQTAEVIVCGKALALGENTPNAGATVKVYELNSDNGERIGGTPKFTITVNDKGFWGPITIKSRTNYEFEVISTTAGDRVVHYYREGFVSNNPLVYLRTLPPASSLAGQLLAGLPKNDNQTVMAVFTANQAVVAGRDSLIVDNTVLSTTAITPASATVIAMFLYDDNNNQQTNLTKPFLFSVLNSFLTARDVYFQTSTPYAIPLRFNGRTLHVRNLKSATDGVVVAVFD